MGEGWSDFMATAVRVKVNDTRNATYPIGAWVSGLEQGVRMRPYSTNMTVNELTYASVNGLSEPHAIGTVWASILYEVLWNLLDRYGKTADIRPTMVAGVPTDGRYLAMKLIMDGLALYVVCYTQPLPSTIPLSHC